MNRREFLAWMGMGAAGLLARRAIAQTPPAAAPQSPAGAKAKGPNLLIIHTDEHNFRTLGCYRALMSPDQATVWGKQGVLDTPNIDRIAKDGAVCTKFYATTPVCSPSRSAFMTGRYPQNTPVTTNDLPMSDEVVTFAEVLRRGGYATGYAGKWHLDGPGKPQWAPKRQFGFADNRYMYNRGHWKKLEDTPAGPAVAGGKLSYNLQGADEKSFTTDFLAGKTIDFIRAHKDEPFCFMVSIPDPHGPNTVRPPYDTMFNGMTFEAPRTMSKPASAVAAWAPKQVASLAAENMHKYFGMVKCIDDNVGRILGELDKLALTERTVVVFTSDHGDLCGEHGRFNKGVPYETSAKVPFLIRAPGKIKPGTVVGEALGCVDFAPTILALMGQPAPSDAQGRDASGLLVGKAPADWKDITFFRSTSASRNAPGNWLAAATKRYKLVVSPIEKPWLFDLEKDPDEVANYLDDPACRDVLRQLARDLLAYGKKYGDPDVDDPPVKADLQWAAEGTGPYVSPARRATQPAKAGKAGKKAAKKAKQTAEE